MVFPAGEIQKNAKSAEQELYYSKDSPEYGYIDVQVNLDAVKPKLDSIHDDIPRSGFQAFFGGISSRFNRISSQQGFVDNHEKTEFCQIVADAIGAKVRVDYEDDERRGPHAKPIVSEKDGKIEVGRGIHAGEVKDFWGVKRLGYSPELRPQYPASHGPDTAFSFMMIHEAEHLADHKQFFDAVYQTKQQPFDVLAASVARNEYVFEVSADLAALAYYDTQTPDGEMQELYLNGRSMDSIVLNAALYDKYDHKSFDVSHTTAYSIRHLQETGELIRAEPLEEAYHTLGGYLSNYIDKQAGGVPYFDEEAVDDILREVAQNSLRKLKRSEYTRELFAEAEEDDPQAVTKIREFYRAKADKMEVGFEHATVLNTYNPRFLMAGLEQGLQNGEFEGLTKDIAVDTVKSLKGLGYKPFHGTPEEHQEYIAENVVKQQIDIHKRFTEYGIDSIAAKNGPKIEPTETIEVVDDSTLQCIPRQDPVVGV